VLAAGAAFSSSLSVEFSALEFPVVMVMGVPARIKLPGGRPQKFVKKTTAVVATVPAATAATAPAASKAVPEQSAASVSA
jgi:hypothetical protein